MDVTSELDLTPLPVSEPAPGRRRLRWPAMLLVVAVVTGIGFVLSRGLSDASMFFYNVDEAVAKRDEIGTKRVRLQGNVVEESVKRTEIGVDFDIKFGGQVVNVRHTGEPPELFGPQIPAVIEGNFATTSPKAPFVSDRILIRHDATYDEKNPDRIATAERDANEATAGTP